MIRIAVFGTVATVALAGAVAFGGRDSVEAGPPLSSNIPGDATCDGVADGYDTMYDMFVAANIAVSLACFTNGNVICGDAIGLSDAMEILKHDSGLVTQVPPNCLPVGVDAAHGTVSGGSATVHGTFTFDIDAGMEGPPSGADFQWAIHESNPFDASIEPDAGAEIAMIVTSRPFEQVTYSQVALAQFSDQPLRNTALFDNFLLGVKTTDGNYAKVKLVSILYDMPIEWVTYSPAP